MDILNHPSRANTASASTPREELRNGSVHCSSEGDDGFWTAIGQYCAGHGWDIDVRRDGKLVAMRNGAFASMDAGMDVVSDTLDDVRAGRQVSKTWFV